MNASRIAAAALACTLAGCASGPRYACGVPQGVTCKPVSEVYASSVGGDQVGESVTTAAPVLAASTSTVAGTALRAESPAPVHGAGASADVPESVAPPAAAGHPVVATVEPGAPVLAAPHVLRVWIAPWEDDTGDLHGETYLYLRLDEGRWAFTP